MYAIPSTGVREMFLNFKTGRCPPMMKHITIPVGPTEGFVPDYAVAVHETRLRDPFVAEFLYPHHIYHQAAAFLDETGEGSVRLLMFRDARQGQFEVAELREFSRVLPYLRSAAMVSRGRLKTMADHTQRTQDVAVAEIEGATWDVDADVALEQAHLIAERQERRRTGTDGKASSYLLVVAALVPILTYLESGVWERKVGTAPQWLSLSILGIAVLHLLAAAVWAFRTLNVGRSHIVGTNELVGYWRGATAPQGKLIGAILRNARVKLDIIDEKVSAIMLAHIHLRRAVVYFCVLLLTQVAWSVGTTVAERLKPPPATPPKVQDKPSAPPARDACDGVEPASERATAVMNKAFAKPGFRGGEAYWTGLASSRVPRAAALGQAWTQLRDAFEGAQAETCRRATARPAP